MTIDVKLFVNEKETEEGFPLAIMITHKRDRKRKNNYFLQRKSFIKDGKTISDKHPDYDVLAPM